jgi:transposase
MQLASAPPSATSILVPGASGATDEKSWPLEIKNVGCCGLLGKLWDELGLTRVVDEHVPIDDQVGLALGHALKALVLNIVGGRDPLYRVQRWAEDVPLDIIVGEGVRCEQLNDTALGRHLDRLFEAGAEGVFNAACLRVIDVEGIRLERMQGDTTSRLVFGAYRHDEDDAISITHGHSKDKRPDLKQMMYGLVTSTDGIPLVGQVLSGNTSDKTWHGGMLDIIQRRYVENSGRAVHYIGDSALVTSRNFELAHQNGIVVTSRLPRTISLTDSVVLRAVYEPLPMEDIGTFGAQKGATRYEACVVSGCQLFGRPVQLGVYRPMPASERTRDAVFRRREKALAVARRAGAKLMARRFCCERDARVAIEAFEVEHLQVTHADRLISVSSNIVEERVPAARPRGRPRKDSEQPSTIECRIVLAIEADEANMEAIIKRESCFVLVHTGTEPITARDLMAAYKGQVVVEKRFPFLKDPAWAEVFFLKTPHRVEALGYVLLLALLLWSVWERRVRANLKHSGEKPLVDTTGMKKANPTAAVCRHILDGIRVMRLRDGDAYTLWQLAAPLTAEQQRVARFSQAPAVKLLAPAENRRLSS